MLVGVGGGGRPRGNFKLQKYVADVSVDGLLADEKLSRDRLVGLAGRQLTKHLHFTGGQAVGAIPRAGAVSQHKTLNIGLCSNHLEHRLGRIKLQLCSVLVAESSVSETDLRAQPGD